MEAGLQGERTGLAWQRTALSVLTGTIILFRLTEDRIGPVAAASVVVALPLTWWVLVVGRQRYPWHGGAAPDAVSRDGRAAAGLTVVIVTMTLTELLAILTT